MEPQAPYTRKDTTATAEDQTMMNVALKAGAKGVAVFPAWGVSEPDENGERHCLCDGLQSCEGGKNAGKHPITPRGLKDATTNPDTIRAWWTKHPQANIAGATGERSGFDVLDVDGPSGKASLNGRRLPKTYNVTTGREEGGKHHYFKHRPGMRNTAKKIGPGLDTRGDGGYVLLAGSRHPSGKLYEGSDPDGFDPAALPEWPKWAVKAIEESNRKASSTFTTVIPEGERNTTLTSEAGALRRRGASETAILAYLRERNEDCETPLDDEALRRIAASVCRYEPASPLLLAPKTTAGDGERYAHVYGDSSRYCPALGAWFHYEGGTWKEDVTLKHQSQAKEVARLTQLAATNLLTGDPTRDENINHALKMENGKVRREMVEAARSELAIRSDQFDTNPDLINFTNGTFDLATGGLRAFDPSDLITRQTAAAYEPSARSEEWLELIEWITDGDAELAAYLQMAIGYSLTGYTTDEALFFVHGPAATGKSTFIEAVKKAFGTYAATADFETFLKRHHGGGGGAREDVARLNGPRFVASIEVEKGKKLAVGIVKAMTGGDTIAARHLYKATTEFRPSMKLWLVANDAPEMEEDDTGLWRRVQKIPMEHVVPEGERDPGLKLRLTDPEVSGAAILNWAVEGAKKWKAAGKEEAPGKLIVPDSVKRATAKLREANDHIQQFIEDRCEVGPGLSETMSQVRESYTGWCKEQKHEPERERAFGQKMMAKGFTKVRGTGGAWRWQGLAFQTSGMADLSGRYAGAEQEQLAA
jgi:putative DNA primase/helicase